MRDASAPRPRDGSADAALAIDGLQLPAGEVRRRAGGGPRPARRASSSPAGSASTDDERAQRRSSTISACSACTRTARPTPPHGRGTGGRVSTADDVPVALVVPTDEELRHRPGHRVTWPERRPRDAHRAGRAATGHGVGLTAACLGLVHGAAASRRRGRRLLQAAAPSRDRTAPPSTGRQRLVRLTTVAAPAGADRRRRGASSRLSESALDAADGGRASPPAEPVLRRHDVVVVEGLGPGLRAGLLRPGEPGTGQGAGRRRPARRRAVRAATSTHLAETMAIAARTYRAGEHDRVVGCGGQPARRTPTARDGRSGCGPRWPARGITLVGAVPFRAELTWPRVRDLVAGLDVRVLNEGEPDRRVKDVIVAAQAVPGRAAAAARGPRWSSCPATGTSVILSVCLAAMNGIRLAGLLLTVGVEPDPRVWKLCRPALGDRAADPAHRRVQLRDRDRASTTSIRRCRSTTSERARLVMTAVADALRPAAGSPPCPRPATCPRLSPPAFRRRLTTAARAADRRIVLPGGRRAADAAGRGRLPGARHRAVRAARRAARGRRAGRRPRARPCPPASRSSTRREIGERYVDALVAARRHKGMTADTARDAADRPDHRSAP